MAFLPGQSGNINGRPKGIADSRTKLRRLLEPHAEQLVAKAVELALDGDIGALKICLDRLIPRIKDISESPEDESKQGAAERVREILQQYNETTD